MNFRFHEDGTVVSCMDWTNFILALPLETKRLSSLDSIGKILGMDPDGTDLNHMSTSVARDTNSTRTKILGVERGEIFQKERDICQKGEIS